MRCSSGSRLRSLDSWDSRGSRCVSKTCNIDKSPTDVIPQWNFEKFLIDKDGKVVERWASLTTPETIDIQIAKII